MSKRAVTAYVKANYEVRFEDNGEDSLEDQAMQAFQEETGMELCDAEVTEIEAT